MSQHILKKSFPSLDSSATSLLNQAPIYVWVYLWVLFMVLIDLHPNNLINFYPY